MTSFLFLFLLSKNLTQNKIKKSFKTEENKWTWHEENNNKAKKIVFFNRRGKKTELH